MDTPFKKLYDALPPFVQNVAVTGYSILLDKQRYGGDFIKVKNFLEESQWYSERQLVEYQERMLAKLIQYSYLHVEYYKNLMDEYKLKPSDIKTIGDLQKLPILTKDLIKNNFKSLLSDEYSLKTVDKGHTSGTTGSPLEICYSKNLINYNYAMLDRQYSWAGVNLGKFGDRVAVIRGNIIVPLNTVKPPFWRYNYLHNQLLLSSFHLKPENIDLYLDELRNYSPKTLDGYPSTVYILAKYLKNKGEKLKLHSVLTSSETLYDFQRETIEESFDCKVYDYYGSAERVLFTTECNKHTGGHIGMEYGITEICDSNGITLENGATGTVIATSLHNYAMPLIRYKTNDNSAIKTVFCDCGRVHKLLDDVTTKAEDTIVLKDGRMISPSVLTHPFKPLTSILESQIIQNEISNITVKLRVDNNFNEDDKQALVHGLSDRLGKDTNIDIELVDSLERTSTGKFKWVISKINLNV
jgi:phenylacetate-CoA ligase